MKICIIGASGSGKTTFAKNLSIKLKIKHNNLDYIIWDQKRGERGRKLRNSKSLNREVSKLIKDKSWIVEGVYVIPSILANADAIIWIKPSLIKTIYRQWKRYFTDEVQRKEHGFKNNLKLTKFKIRYHFSDLDKKHLGKYEYSSEAKTKYLLKSYQEKILVLKSNKDIKEYMSTLT